MNTRRILYMSNLVRLWNFVLNCSFDFSVDLTFASRFLFRRASTKLPCTVAGALLGVAVDATVASRIVEEAVVVVEVPDSLA